MATFDAKGNDTLNVISARSLIDHTVIDIEDVYVGTISDIIFEKANGMLAYVRITLTDQRVLVVPYEAIDVQTPGESIKLRMYKEAVGSFMTTDT